MSYDFIDGCDYNSTDNIYINQKWRDIASYSGLNFNLKSGASAHDSSSGGSIGISNDASGWGGIMLRPPERRAVSSDYFLHYWFYLSHLAASDSVSQFLVFTNAPITGTNNTFSSFKSAYSSYTIVELRILTSGYLSLVLNGTVLATATLTNIRSNTGIYHCLRVKINIDDTEGAFQVYVDDNDTPDIDYTGGLYTGGGEGFDSIVFATDYSGGSYGYNIDDIISYVPGGNAPSGHFSEPKFITTTVPASDASPNDGTASTGGSHYATLDELPPSASDYVNLAAEPEDAEMYGFGSAVVPSGATGIEAVAITLWGSASGTTSHTVKGRVDSSSTTGYGETKDVEPGGIAVVQSFINVDPNTSAAWTESGVNAANFGVELVA